MALIVGEMGVGKTRLSEEILRLARQEDMAVLVGRTGQATSTLAYAPFLSAFGSLLRRIPQDRREILLDGLAHLGRLWPDLSLTPPPPLADPELERTLLYESVARLLDRLAAESPVVILLDDLHWADGATLALLSYLTHGLADARVLVLATYRPEGLTDFPALRHLITDAVRSGVAVEVPLRGLDHDDVAAMAEGLLGEAAPSELLEILNDRTAGTPLFVDALVHGLQDADVLVRVDGHWVLAAQERAPTVPRGVRDLVLDRLQALTSTERSVVELVAHDALGLPHELLEETAAEETEHLMAAIARLVKTGLLVQDDDGTDVVYRLFHPLVQDVAAGELPAVASRRVHARLAHAVEQRRAGDIDRLAFHYSRAGREVDPVRALEVLLDAGDRALSVAGHEQAARHLTAAASFIREGQSPEQLGPVLERLGAAWAATGQLAAATEAWAEAMAEHLERGDINGAARICSRGALIARDRGDVESARHQLDAGVMLLRDQPPSAELVDLHHTRLLIDSPLFEPERAAGTVAVMVDAAATLSSPAAKVASLSAEGQLALGQGKCDVARTKAETSLRIAQEAGDYVLEQRARRDLSWILWAQADVTTCEDQVELQLELDRRFGVRAQEPLSKVQFAIFGHFRGTWDDIEAQGEEALAQARRYGQGRVQTIAHGTLAWFLIDRGELDQAEEHLAQARQTIDINGGDRALHWIHIPEALLALERGDPAAARTAAAKLRLPKGRAILADADIAAGDLDTARAIGSRLATAGGRYPEALSERILGLVARGEVDGTAGSEALARSADLLTGMALPFEAAISQFHIGNAASLQPALATFEVLGAQRWAERTRRALRLLGVKVPSARRRHPSGADPLSPREFEVAELAAAGLTKADIAARLVLSIRTVESHLDHIYSRLGISGRAELTRWVAGRAESP